jgi:hypothetical protein
MSTTEIENKCIEIIAKRKLYSALNRSKNKNKPEEENMEDVGVETRYR